MDKLPYSGRTSAHPHKFDGWEEKDVSDWAEGVRKIWILDAQWSKCPVEVEDQVKDLWRMAELGNDKYIYKSSIKELLESVAEGAETEKFFWGEKPEEKVGWRSVPLKVDYIVQYLREMGVQDEEPVWIHW